VKVKLGGSEVLLWKPDEVIDDSSLMQLDVDLGFEGMKEEIGNLEKCGAGRVIGQAEVDALKKLELFEEDESLISQASKFLFSQTFG
jgi:hypothetical protein